MDIVCIEDQLSIHDTLRERFASKVVAETGITVEYRPALNLHDGLNLLAVKAPDIVLLDLALPDSPSDETASRGVLRIARLCPVAVLTGQETNGRWKESLQNGAGAFLPKTRYLPEPSLPFMMDAIMNTILLWKVQNGRP